MNYAFTMGSDPIVFAPTDWVQRRRRAPDQAVWEVEGLKGSVPIG